MITGIVVALPDELSTLTSAKLKQGQVHQLDGHILVAYSGIGFDNARNAATLLIQSGAQQLISWGCAGALSPSLAAGQCLVADSLINQQGQILHNHKAWNAHITTTLRQLDIDVLNGRLLDSKQLVSDTPSKQRIYKQSDAYAVDMESYAVSLTAGQSNLPCAIVRAIADTAETSLPAAIQYAMTAQGEVSLMKLLPYILMHPWQIPQLIKLGQHFSAAQKTLKSAASQLDTICRFASE